MKKTIKKLEEEIDTLLESLKKADMLEDIIDLKDEICDLRSEIEEIKKEDIIVDLKKKLWDNTIISDQV